MTNFTIEIDTDSDDYVRDAQQLSNKNDLDVGLDAYEVLDNLNDYSPILKVKVENMPRDVQGQKTHWLLAEIFKKHLGNGEPTSKNQTLSAKIRARGKPGDDCGHIIASSLGGKMVDFNLFPQNKLINRGWFGWNRHWRKGIELLIYFWLKKDSLNKRKVEFQVRFYYTDSKFPHRPDHGKFLIILKEDGIEANLNANNRNKEQISNEVYTSLKGTLRNTIENLESVPETQYEEVTKKLCSELNRLSNEQFEYFIWLLLKDFMTDKQQHPEPTSNSSAYRQMPASVTSK